MFVEFARSKLRTIFHFAVLVTCSNPTEIFPDVHHSDVNYSTEEVGELGNPLGSGKWQMQGSYLSVV